MHPTAAGLTMRGRGYARGARRGSHAGHPGGTGERGEGSVGERVLRRDAPSRGWRAIAGTPARTANTVATVAALALLCGLPPTAGASSLCRLQRHRGQPAPVSPKPMCKQHLPWRSNGVTCRCSLRGPDGLEGAILGRGPVKAGVPPKQRSVEWTRPKWGAASRWALGAGRGEPSGPPVRLAAGITNPEKTNRITDHTPNSGCSQRRAIDARARRG